MVPLRILRALLPPAERDEILADLEREYRDRRARDGRLPATDGCGRKSSDQDPCSSGAHGGAATAVSTRRATQ